MSFNPGGFPSPGQPLTSEFSGGFAPPPADMPSPNYGATQQTQQSYGGGTAVIDTRVTSGNFQENGQNKLVYRIEHRDSNSILILNLLVPDAQLVKAKPGAMVAMSADTKIEGKVRFRYSCFDLERSIHFRYASSK